MSKGSSSHAGRHKENSALHISKYKSNSYPIPPLALLTPVQVHQTVASSGELLHLTLGSSMLSLTRTQFFTPSPSVVQSQNPISQPTLPFLSLPFFSSSSPSHFLLPRLCLACDMCAPAISSRIVGQITVSHRWDEGERKRKERFFCEPCIILQLRSE